MYICMLYCSPLYFYQFFLVSGETINSILAAREVFSRRLSRIMTFGNANNIHEKMGGASRTRMGT